MINLFKRYVLWNARMIRRTPGLRAYGRFLEEQYTKRFWTTYLTGLGLGLAAYFGSRWYIKKVQEEDREFQETLDRIRAMEFKQHQEQPEVRTY